MDLEVKAEENIETKESLTNNKRWFDGVHSFSSIKINPPVETPPVLRINISDTSKVTSTLA